MASVGLLYRIPPRHHLLRKQFAVPAEILAHPRTRPFHASHLNFEKFTTTSSAFVDHALDLSHSAFENIHAYTGLPWALAIPLTAVLSRLLYAPAQYLINKDQQACATYVPLLEAWRTNLRGQARLKFMPTIPENREEAETWIDEQMELKRKELGSAVQSKTIKHSALKLGFLPIWALNLDVVRRMTGTDTTLFDILSGTEDKVDHSVAQAQPSFVTEGMLWFPDLTIADPTLILPMAFGATLLANWWYMFGKRERNKKMIIWNPTKLTPEKDTGIRGDDLSFGVLSTSALAVLILIIHEIPSGVCLYLLASANFALVQRRAMRKLMGLKPQMEVMKPLRPVLKNPGKKVILKPAAGPSILKAPGIRQ